jgi:uncharacterized membrane protein
MATDDPDPDDLDASPDIEAVFAELEELEELVDTEAERRQVRETMRTLRRADRPGVIGRFRSGFGSRDAGEAVVGSFVFGAPAVVEDGTLAAGAFLAGRPAFLAVTLALGVGIVGGILHAGEFERVAEDRLAGVIPVRLVGILLIAAAMSVGLLTAWGRVNWADPVVAGAQALLVGIVMAVGAAIGDIVPER